MARRSKYDWHLWTDGTEHTIYRHRDYTISTYNMQISLHGRARKDGTKVETSTVIGRQPDEHGLMETLEGLRFRFRTNGQ